MNQQIKSFIYTILKPFLIRKGDDGYVYITFDDGPHPENTAKILKILNTNNTHATFFMTGKEMRKYPDIVKQVHAMGHSIGYHGYSHVSMKKQSFSEFVEDMRQGRSLSNEFNVPIDLYRPPFGDISLSGLLYLMLSGWKIIMWSKDSRDSYDSEEQILQTLDPANIEQGEILLFHDDYEKTANLLETVIKRLKQANLQFGERF